MKLFGNQDSTPSNFKGSLVGMLQTVTTLAYQAYYLVTNPWLTRNHRNATVITEVSKRAFM
jgi:hypothetical protein